MDSIKKLSRIKLIEAIVAAVVSLGVAIFVNIIAFISMFADNSFGWGEFFFTGGMANTGALICIGICIANGLEIKFSKNIINGLSTLGHYEKRFKILSIAQIAADGVVLLIISIYTIIGLVEFISGDGYQSLLVVFLLGSFSAIFAAVNLIQNVMTLNKLKNLYQ